MRTVWSIASFVITIFVMLTLSIIEKDLMLMISVDDLGDGDVIVIGNCDDEGMDESSTVVDCPELF